MRAVLNMVQQEMPTFKLKVPICLALYSRKHKLELQFNEAVKLYFEYIETDTYCLESC